MAMVTLSFLALLAAARHPWNLALVQWLYRSDPRATPLPLSIRQKANCQVYSPPLALSQVACRAGLGRRRPVPRIY
ncbi:hypothetical protein EDD15DRAFT_2288640 [Pisolithus albus]|nr:hypothetical protein EDD15DRAFT_2288640 [Pisolithus albus]